MQVSYDVYLPVDLIGGLLAEGGIRCPTSRTDSLLLRYVVDLLDGLKGGVVPSAMPGTPGLLTPGASRTYPTCDIFAYRRPDRLTLLRRGTKDELGECRHLLGECADLAFEFANPYPQRRVFGLKASIIASQALCLGLPVR
jgi:hypothetical protein